MGDEQKKPDEIAFALPQAGVPDAHGTVYSEEAIAKLREQLASGDVPVVAEPGALEELKEQRRRWKTGAGVGIAGRVALDDIEELPDGTRVLHKIDLHSVSVISADQVVDPNCVFRPAHEHKMPPAEGGEEQSE